MNEQTKLKILETLHDIPLEDLAQRVHDARTEEDRRFWQSLHTLEKGQRSRRAS